MRIILHGGFHKTGTSSLQAALAAHRAALAGRVGVQTLHLSPGLSKATEAARAFSVAPDLARLRAAMADWAAGLAAEWTAGGDLVISSEDFAGHMPGRFGVADYGAVVQVLPVAAEALGARFPGAEVVVLMTTRAAEPWLKSLHWQLSLHPELQLKQRRFCKDRADLARFDRVLEPLGRALEGRARLEVKALETLAARRLGPVEAVYDLLDLPADLRDGLEPVPRSNARIAEGLADQFVRLNRAGLPEAELRRAKSAMQGVMQALEAE